MQEIDPENEKIRDLRITLNGWGLDCIIEPNQVKVTLFRDRKRTYATYDPSSRKVVLYPPLSDEVPEIRDTFAGVLDFHLRDLCYEKSSRRVLTQPKKRTERSDGGIEYSFRK